MERRAIVQIFLSIFVVLCPYTLVASVSDNLYTVVIQVTDNNLATRNKHLPRAFEVVVKRVASSKDILAEREYLDSLEHLDRFVSHYFYTENDGAYNLTLRFNPQMINNLINKAGRKILTQREDILLWLVVTTPNEPASFVAYHTHDNVAKAVEVAANTFGVPVIMPLIDLTERLFISEEDVLTNNIKALKLGAERYSADTILLGNVKQADDIWYCEWNLFIGDVNVAWSSEDIILEPQIDSMVSTLADKMIAFKQSSTANRIAENISVRVNGLGSAADYAKVLEHLKCLNSVQQVEIGNVYSDYATFTLKSDSDREKVIRDLKTSKILAFNSSATSNLANEKYLDLKYRTN